jgi:hypothetical protein
MCPHKGGRVSIASRETSHSQLQDGNSPKQSLIGTQERICVLWWRRVGGGDGWVVERGGGEDGRILCNVQLEPLILNFKLVREVIEAQAMVFLQGKSGVSPIVRFDTSDFSTKFAGEIKELDVEGYINKKNARRLDDTIKYILVSGKQVPPPPSPPRPSQTLTHKPKKSHPLGDPSIHLDMADGSII